MGPHDPAGFTDTGALTQHEEASGIIDVSALLAGVGGDDTDANSYFLATEQRGNHLPHTPLRWNPPHQNGGGKPAPNHRSLWHRKLREKPGQPDMRLLGSLLGRSIDDQGFKSRHALLPQHQPLGISGRFGGFQTPKAALTHLLKIFAAIFHAKDHHMPFLLSGASGKIARLAMAHFYQSAPRLSRQNPHIAQDWATRKQPPPLSYRRRKWRVHFQRAAFHKRKYATKPARFPAPHALPPPHLQAKSA